jgi:hypothetical protein
MTSSPSGPNGARRLPWLLIGLSAAIGLAGYYGPWVAHKAAGLVVIGLDLAEMVKFLPLTQAGRVAVQREVFYLPLVAGSLTASLMASRRALPLWARWLLALIAVPLALAMLPPAWSPGILWQQEFRIQTLAIAGCLILVPGIVLTRYLPGWLVLAILALAAMLAAIGPLWGFFQIRPGINYVYNRPPAIGWGLWVSLLGFMAEAVLATAEILRPDRRIRPRRNV